MGRWGRLARAAALWVACATPAACVRDPVDVRRAEGGVVMIGLVSAHTDTASMLLSRITTHETPENGATVHLETPHGAVALVASAEDACGLPQGWACYRGAYAVPPQPGDEVRIEGELADGTPISGVTVVPLPPVLHDSVAAVVADTLRSTALHTPLMVLDQMATEGWVSIAGGDVAADVWVAGARQTCQARVFETFFDLRHASFVVAVGEPQCEDATVPWDSLAVEIRVEAFDPSFTSYWEHTVGSIETLFATEASWGVEGVFGVFGSSAPRRLALVVSAVADASPR